MHRIYCKQEPFFLSSPIICINGKRSLGQKSFAGRLLCLRTLKQCGRRFFGLRKWNHLTLYRKLLDQAMVPLTGANSFRLKGKNFFKNSRQ